MVEYNLYITLTKEIDMRLCESKLSIKFDAKVNNVNGSNATIILAVFNEYNPVKDKYLFSVYVNRQKENGTNEFLCGFISPIDNPFDLTRYQSAKGLSLEGISIQRDRKLSRLFISGSAELDSVQTCEVTLYFNNPDEMDRCYGAILECFYDVMNFCGSRKLSVVEES